MLTRQPLNATPFAQRPVPRQPPLGCQGCAGGQQGVILRLHHRRSPLHSRPRRRHQIGASPKRYPRLAAIVNHDGQHPMQATLLLEQAPANQAGEQQVRILAHPLHQAPVPLGLKLDQDQESKPLPVRPPRRRTHQTTSPTHLPWSASRNSEDASGSHEILALNASPKGTVMTVPSWQARIIFHKIKHNAPIFHDSDAAFHAWSDSRRLDRPDTRH